MSPNIFELIQQLCPDGVEYRQTDELFALRNGYTPSKSNDSYWSNGTVPWFRLDDIAVNGRLLSVSQRYVSSDAVKGDLFPAETIIVSTSATIGEHALILVPFLVNQRFTCLSLKEEYKGVCDIRFLFHVTFLFSAFCKSHCHRGNMLSVDMNAFRSFRWPLPPLPVQQEIVRILDTFDTYRNDVTAGLAGELAMRRKQFQYWQEKLLSFDDSVPRKALGEVGVLIKGMSSVTSKWCDTGNCRFIDYKNVYDHRFVDVSDLPLATVKNKERQTVLQVGDVLFTSASEVVDECAISSVVRDDISPNVLLDDHLFGIRLCDQTVLDPVFLNYYCQTEFFRASVRRVVRGVTRFYVGLKDFERIAIPIPPLVVQQEIVRVLDVFVELERELERELELRAKQFEYYRDHLLAFPEKKGA